MLTHGYFFLSCFIWAACNSWKKKKKEPISLTGQPLFKMWDLSTSVLLSSWSTGLYFHYNYRKNKIFSYYVSTQKIAQNAATDGLPAASTCNR